MKNLKLLWNLVKNLCSEKNSSQFVVAGEGADSHLYCVKAGVITSISLTTRRCKDVGLLEKYYKSKAIPEVISIFYNPIMLTLNIALTNGDVLSLDYSKDSVELQCVGIIESGLKVMEWSPDMETVVFVTGDDTLILMTGAFDPVNEVSLIGSEVSEQEMVNVGWGKKETQFHGSEGKQAAKIAPEIAGQDSTADDKKVRVSWRGDSNLFAVSYFCQDSKVRKIKIFSRQGNLQSVGEKLNGLNEPIAWRPSGNLIALTQNLPNKYVVCFMEKNGLRHGDFTLPPGIKIKELSWNSESTILCTLGIDDTTRVDCALLWTCSNYCWSLKQRIDFASPVVALRWDQTVGNRVHILLTDGTYLSHQYTWCVDHSYGIAEHDLSYVAVVDGRDIKLTPFKKTVVPPPMCGVRVTLPSPALQVMFAPCTGEQQVQSESSLGSNPNNLCVFMSDGKLAFISQTEAGTKVESVFEIEWSDETLSPATSHWVWLSSYTFLCSLSTTDGKVHLCELQLRQEKILVVQTIELEKPVTTVSRISGQYNQAVIQLQDGELLKYESDASLILWNFDLPEPCAKLWADGDNVYALSERYRLFINDMEIANNVTSFFYFPPFLIVTLTQHVLRVLNIRSVNKSENNTEASRRVERGSQIVVALGDSVVLQVPRGNLETIQPRALTLVTAAKLLDNCDYKPLAQLLRRQRIDLNLCVDHNPSLFLLSVARFVQQIHDPQWFSVFLSELNEGDTTRKIYAAHYDQSTRPPPLPNKVERICTALRSAMSLSDADKELYIFPILISHIKTGDIVQALSLANTDKALNYLTLFLDTDRLYDEALGAYNLEKALKVAAKSQKDPKEYVTYLNELRQMEPSYMKYTIDKRLRKFASALTHLAECQGDKRFHECLALIEEHALYARALQLFQGQQERYKTVALVYAEFLLTKRKYEEAGLMYIRSGHLDEAIEAYTRVGDWRQCVVLAKKRNFSDNDLQQLYKNLLDVLKSHESFKDAAELCRELLRNIDLAVTCLVDGRCWAEAVYLCETNQRLDLIDKVIQLGVLDTTNSLLSEMKTHKDLLEKHSSRLVQVRQDKFNKTNNPNYDAMSDLQSETGSVSSYNTSSTGGSRSTKNTRKMQRKMWSLKEGNPREEQALLSEISQSIQAVYKMTGEVRNTSSVLVRFSLDSKANNLQSSMSSTLVVAEKVISIVWPVKKSNQDQDADNVTQMDSQLAFPPANCPTTLWQMDMFNT